MKRILTILLFVPAALSALFVSCDDDETYADKRERENKQINSFLQNGVRIKDSSSSIYLLDVPGGINVISEGDFTAKGEVTDTARNEYVYFGRTGVYMQILEKGSGEKIKSGETLEIVTRYTEYNIAADSIQSTNKNIGYEMSPDYMICTNTYGTFTGTFTRGAMYTTYSSQAVPAGWLVPLTYINLGRLDSATAKLAKVRLIVPSTQGHANASANVYPCFYEITYQRGR